MKLSGACSKVASKTLTISSRIALTDQWSKQICDNFQLKEVADACSKQNCDTIFSRMELTDSCIEQIRDNFQPNEVNWHLKQAKKWQCSVVYILTNACSKQNCGNFLSEKH